MASARLTVHPAGYLCVSTQTGLQSLPSRAGSGLPIKPCSFKMLKTVCARTSAAGTTLWKPLFISVSLEAMKVCLSVVADSYNITLGRSPFCRLKAPGRERAPWGGKSGSWDNLGKVKSCLKGTACGNGHDLWMEEGALGWNGCDPWLLGVRTHGCDLGYDFEIVLHTVLLFFPFSVSLVIISGIFKPLVSFQVCCLEKFIVYSSVNSFLFLQRYLVFTNICRVFVIWLLLTS